MSVFLQQILAVCSHCRNSKSLNRMPIRITIILTRWRMNPNRRSGNERTNIYIPFSPHRKYSKQVSCKFTAGRAKIYFPPARIKHSERINWENQIGSSEKPSVYLWGVYSLWTYVFWNRNHFKCGRILFNDNKYNHIRQACIRAWIYSCNICFNCLCGNLNIQRETNGQINAICQK